ncbi:hypothetical protein ODU73_002505 [Thermoclostridium stercorarium]|uniref:hypothetical protein n=1 Tax=Thermoclostridium stercorarium TaxID=1510 RepID=UPI00224899AC|nr:hypothetical protein [Thermoclostridium stercorarium]UZQ85372.1 hypothetical protein ODU73_002505 [Thermoclostridium stercorarium]
MNEIFRRIIEIDNRAKELFSEDAKERERLRQDTVREIESMRNQIRQMADEKIEQLVSQNRKDVDEKVKDINSAVAEKLTAMEEKYIQNADEWVERIFLSVVRE